LTRVSDGDHSEHIEPSRPGLWRCHGASSHV
jgi:hypothetical protein